MEIKSKAIWGVRSLANKRSLIAINDYEYIAAIGTGIMIFDNNPHGERKTYLVNSHSEAVCVLLMELSADEKYLATVVKMGGSELNAIHILVYEVEHLRSEHRPPRLITYKNAQCLSTGATLECKCVSFSHDNQHMAVGTNVPAAGVVIFDTRKGKVFQTINSEKVPYHVTFNPTDSSKICVTGANGLVKFWRFTNKSVHPAPMVGLRGNSLNYTSHLWIPPYSDGLVAVATQNGMIAVLLGCEQKGPNIPAFGAPPSRTDSPDHSNHHIHHHSLSPAQLAHEKHELHEKEEAKLHVSAVVVARAPQKNLADHKPDPHFVTHLLLRGDVILVVSQYNEIAAFEIRRVMQSKGVNHLSPSLAALHRYRLSNVDALQGMDWCVRDSVTSFSVLAMSTSSVFQVEVIGDTDREETGTYTGELKQEGAESLDWVTISNEQNVFQFHAGAVHSLSLSSRTNMLLTSSRSDGTVHVWDFNRPSSYHGSWVVESFKERPEEMFAAVAMHPSGLLAAFACETQVREYAITSRGLEAHRVIDIRGPFVGANGQAHVISQPVSLVAYSHGGQFLAVVAGKIAQVFSMNVLDYDSVSGGRAEGTPAREMVLVDHAAPITAVAFNRGDTRLITTDCKGAVYSSELRALQHDQETLFEGMNVRSIAVGRSKKQVSYIAAALETRPEEPVEPLYSSHSQKVSRTWTAESGYPMDGGATQRPTRSKSPAEMSASRGRGRNTSSGIASIADEFLVAEEPLRYFVAVWEDAVSNTPQLLQLSSPAVCVSVGTTDGAERQDICVIGLADGRVLVAPLPLPIARHHHHHHHHHKHVAIAPEASATVQQKAERWASRRASDASVGTTASNTTATSGTSASTSASASTVASATKAATALNKSGVLTPQASHHSILTNQRSADVVAEGSVATVAPAEGERLDESRCRVLHMHYGPVNQVAVSENGLWIFSGGEDGVVQLYSTSKRAHEMVEVPYIPESMENAFRMVDKARLLDLQQQLVEVQDTISLNRREYDTKMELVLQIKGKVVGDLQAKMSKEVKQRDESIYHSSNEFMKLQQGVKSEVRAIRQQCEQQSSDLEHTYQKKLRQEAVYLDKMKQAYDEYVVHSRMDLAELQRSSDSRIEGAQKQRNSAVHESEKQKATVLQYFEFIRLQNDESISALESKQTDERCKIKDDMLLTAQELDRAKGHLLTGEVQSNRDVKKLQGSIQEIEADVERLRAAVDWSQGRIGELEGAMSTANAELDVRTQMSDKWEQKTREMQVKIVELEKLRKALTTQLHTLRQELAPKEVTLARVADKLQETDREYEMSLQAIAEKKKTLGQKTENLMLLQKQVRELNLTTSRKEKVLRRAATLLDQYRVALVAAYLHPPPKGWADGEAGDTAAGEVPSAATSRRNSRKPGPGLGLAAFTGTAAVGAGEEIIAQHEGMKTALRRLSDVLMPFLNEDYLDADLLDEVQQVRLEQERHMYLLHRNVNGLRANLDLAHQVADSKVQHHLGDNQQLLKEVNSLRFEVRNLSMENQRLASEVQVQASSGLRRQSHSEGGFGEEEFMGRPEPGSGKGGAGRSTEQASQVKGSGSYARSTGSAGKSQGRSKGSGSSVRSGPAPSSSFLSVRSVGEASASRGSAKDKIQFLMAENEQQYRMQAEAEAEASYSAEAPLSATLPAIPIPSINAKSARKY